LGGRGGGWGKSEKVQLSFREFFMAWLDSGYKGVRRRRRRI
jgi:hypothetical protein